MKEFKNILYVTFGVQEETEALKQAISLARNNGARLKVLLIYPDFPKELLPHLAVFESSARERLQQAIQSSLHSLSPGGTNTANDPVPIEIEIESGNTPAIRVIQRVQRDGHDLLIKDADTPQKGKGPGSIDMTFLRKCPCPVWRCHPAPHHRNQIHVAVAIDPDSTTPEGHHLSLRLLKVARSLADTCSGNLTVLSCWDFQYENDLRHNVWMKTSSTDLAQWVAETESNHRSALDSIIKESGIGGAIEIHHLHGRPEEIIPAHAREAGLNFLVMGTLARSGIPGFFIGNTAENILQSLECSLLALKPGGFVSPVKAY